MFSLNTVLFNCYFILVFVLYYSSEYGLASKQEDESRKSSVAMQEDKDMMTKARKKIFCKNEDASVLDWKMEKV